jgi:hypothetical protein
VVAAPGLTRQRQRQRQELRHSGYKAAPMLHIATALWTRNRHSGRFCPGYDETWVERLYRGFRRNLTVPFCVSCLFVSLGVFLRTVRHSIGAAAYLRRGFMAKHPTTQGFLQVSARCQHRGRLHDR